MPQRFSPEISVQFVRYKCFMMAGTDAEWLCACMGTTSTRASGLQ